MVAEEEELEGGFQLFPAHARRIAKPLTLKRAVKTNTGLVHTRKPSFPPMESPSSLFSLPNVRKFSAPALHIMMTEEYESKLKSRLKLTLQAGHAHREPLHLGAMEQDCMELEAQDEAS